MNTLAKGLLAGAAGTIALDLTTYADMAARGRPTSTVPADSVREIARKLGADGLATPDDTATESTKNRRTGLGAMMGYTVGLGVGSASAFVRPFLSPLPFALRAAIIGAAAMASSDVPSSMLRVTKPSTWSKSAWLSDIVPHLIFGVVVAATLDATKDKAPPKNG